MKFSFLGRKVKLGTRGWNAPCKTTWPLDTKK
jgi:hypothetical protein